MFTFSVYTAIPLEGFYSARLETRTKESNDPKDGELCLCKTKSGETLMELKCTSSAQRSHKRCWFIQTAGRWPWKSESAKECVTTHLPNELALKMDCALAGYLCSAIHVK
eukprot:maker-scaffold_125-snap-gene-0.10-mRNA-1 protein AED:0.53 eAED:0.60 QI:0/0/0/0.75/0/0/4/0/109